MSNEANVDGQDVFDDSGASDVGATDPSAGGSSEDTAEGGLDADSADDAAETDNTGEKDSGTPPEDQNDLETVTDAKGQKLIPEHRFKAALKSATERAEKAEAENAKLTAPAPIPVPDKDVDPEGHSRHVRMEASVQVMREMRSDYQEVINHYAEMAKDNPLLDQAVDANPLPAKLAYDIAKKDLEIKEALALKNSPEWQEFQEFKANKGKIPAAEEQTLNKKVANGLRVVPNLNRSTNASPNRNVRKNSNGENNDDLFVGAL